MPNSDIRFGRKHLLFDDPKKQAYYDALFKLGNLDSKTPFDVNNPADLAKVGIIDPPENGEEHLVFPLRPDIDKVHREQKLETTVDMIPSLEGRSERSEKLVWRTPAERAEHDKLETSDPARWAEEKQRISDSVTEAYLRRNISRMMEGHVVLMDQKNKEYPRELTVNENYWAELENVPETMPEAPEAPEKPWFLGLRRFFANTFGWGKETIENYEKALDQYHKDMDAFHKADTARRLTAKAWPEYAQEGKQIEAKAPSEEKLATLRLDKLSDTQRCAAQNIEAVFGEKPGVRPGMKSVFAGVIEKIDPQEVAVPVNGVTSQQSAAFTHLAMMNKETSVYYMGSNTIFQGRIDHPLMRDRDAQLFSSRGNLQDLQEGRDDLSIFNKKHPGGTLVEQAHAKAKEAYTLWGEKNDPSLMGKLLAEGLPVFTQCLCRSQVGLTGAYVSTMDECEQIYSMLQEHPELREAAIKEGMDEITLQNLEANHQVSQQYQKGMDAKKQLLSGEKFSPEQTKELLTDAMMLNYINGRLIADQAGVQKSVDASMASLSEQINEMQKTGNPADVSLEAGLITLRLGGMEASSPSSEKYRAMSDPAEVARIRENLKNSPVVERLAGLDSKTLAGEMAKMELNPKSPENQRMNLDLFASADKKIAADSKHVENKAPAAAQAEKKVVKQQPAKGPVGMH